MNSMPTDRPSLVKAISQGRAFRYRLFYGHKPSADGSVTDAVFSQWWSAPFAVDGVTYLTAEHWMMAGKARVFGDAEALAAILLAPTPAAAKALGRSVRGFDETRWKAARFDLVTAGNVQKFSADRALREHLLSTLDAVMVEASPTDSIWGIGLSAKNPDALRPDRWRGQNLLGFALMRAREQLRLAVT